MNHAIFQRGLAAGPGSHLLRLLQAQLLDWLLAHPDPVAGYAGPHLIIIEGSNLGIANNDTHT